MTSTWFWITGAFCLFGVIYLLVSGACFMMLGGAVLPVLAETRRQVQDLGDLAANTTSRASETMDIVEGRVSEALGQAAAAGKDATRQAFSIGTVVAGIYVATRLFGEFRSKFSTGTRKRRRRR